MAKIVTSARGEKVDFDLLRIKNSIAAVPPTENVKKRERFINKKRRRGLKQSVDELVQAKTAEASGVQNKKITDSTEQADQSQEVEEILDAEEDQTPSEKTKRKVK